MALLHSTPNKLLDDAFTLAEHVSSIIAKNNNFVISPLSLHVVLSFIAAGSSGPTREQVLSFFSKCESLDHLINHLSEVASFVFKDKDANNGGAKLSIANGVWVDQSFALKPAFRKVVNDAFQAVSEQVDFIYHADEVIYKVNSWVEKQTNGLVKELLPSGSISDATRLVFANGIYFKGEWDLKFDSSLTTEDDFHLLDGSSVRVPFMTSHEEQLICEFSEFDVLQLPYKQGDQDMHQHQLSMYIFLPNQKDGVPTLMAKVGSVSDFLNQHLPFRKVDVDDFRIPKFKISFGFEASQVFKSLGIRLPFDEGGLTEMTDPQEPGVLHVSSIFHKCFIEVNEEGTEAAAASAVGVRYMCAGADFVADHPFLFLVREDKTGVVLFIGCVMNPLEC